VIYITATPEGEQPIAEAAPAEEISPYGPCDHLLWPLREGAAWTYTVSQGDQSRDAVLSSTLENGSLLLTFDGQTTLLNCMDGTISGLPPAPLSGIPWLGSGIAGTNPVGEFLPDQGSLIPFGTDQSWDLEVDVTGTLSTPALAGGAVLQIISGKAVIVSSTRPLETVAVPAGTFTVVPVAQQIFYELTVSLDDGTQQAVLIAATGDLYFSESVGLVKAVYHGGTLSTQSAAVPLEGEVTLELASLPLP
jgi:hypothetical protein